MQDQPDQIAVPGSELDPVGGSNDKAAAGVGEEDARQFILRVCTDDLFLVKQTVERCLAQEMNKAQMFRAIREEGLHLGAAFAVYKELREQNRGFFKDYFCKIDLKEQHQWLNRLLQACRPGDRNAEEGNGVRVPEAVPPHIALEETDVPVNVDVLETVTPAVALEETDVPVDVDWADHQALPQAWWSSDDARQLVDLPAGEQVPDLVQPVPSAEPLAAAWPQQALDLPDWEQLQSHEQLPADGAFQEVAWPDQALHLPATQPQLHYHDETAANGGFPGPVWQHQEVNLQAGHQPPHGHQPPPANGVFQEFAWYQQAEHMPAAQLHYHEQAATAANGLPPPEASAAGLPHEAMMDPVPLSHGSQSLWQEHQRAGTLGQLWHGAGVNPLPSSSLSEPRENQHY